MNEEQEPAAEEDHLGPVRPRAVRLLQEVLTLLSQEAPGEEEGPKVKIMASMLGVLSDMGESSLQDFLRFVEATGRAQSYMVAATHPGSDRVEVRFTYNLPPETKQLLRLR